MKDIRAFVLVDMIGDRDLGIRREQNSTPWLTDAIWSAARRLKRPEFLEETTPIEDDHQEFLEAGIPSVDLIDLDTLPGIAPRIAWTTSPPPAFRPWATSSSARCRPSKHI